MNQHSFQEGFLSFKNELGSFIFRLSGHTQDTEDILQDTYLRATKGLDGFNENASLKTWVFSIATNIVKDHLRAKKRWTTSCMDNAKEDAENNPWLIDKMLGMNRSNSKASGFEIKEHIDFCFTCMAKTLPIEQQVAVILKDVYGFTVHELMAILEFTEGQVKHALTTGRDTLTGIFEKKCALVSKSGACYQCSELNGIFNPLQDQQHELMKIKMVREAASGKTREELYLLRTDLIKSIDPLHAAGTDLHSYFLKLMAHYSEAKQLDKENEL